MVILNGILDDFQHESYTCSCSLGCTIGSMIMKHHRSCLATFSISLICALVPIYKVT